MNVFELIKDSISVEEVATYHGIAFNNRKALRPFHQTGDLALRIGLLKDKEGEIYDAFWKRIIFSVWNRGRITSIRKRKFPDDRDSNFKWMGLPNSELIPNKHISFGDNLNCETRIVTESISDAIAFIKAGIPSCYPIGTEVSQQNSAYFSKAKAKQNHI